MKHLSASEWQGMVPPGSRVQLLKTDYGREHGTLGTFTGEVSGGSCPMVIWDDNGERFGYYAEHIALRSDLAPMPVPAHDPSPF